MAKKKVFDRNSPDAVLAAVQFGEASEKKAAPKMTAKKKPALSNGVLEAGTLLEGPMGYNLGPTEWPGSRKKGSGNTPEEVVSAALGPFKDPNVEIRIHGDPAILKKRGFDI